jgi:hypothetical protein
LGFSIETIGNDVKGMFKKNPKVVYGTIGAAALLGGYVYYKKQNTPAVASDTGAVVPIGSDLAAEGADAGTSDNAALLTELEGLLTSNNGQIADVLTGLQTQISDLGQAFSAQPYAADPTIPEPGFVDSNVAMIEQQMSTAQSAIQKAYSGGSLLLNMADSYSPEDVLAMGDWAGKENNAIANTPAGTIAGGTSYQPNSNMIMTALPSGKVAFTQRGLSTPKDTPAPAGKQYIGAGQLVNQGDKGSDQYSHNQVSKVTGKTGTVEQQLSGMTASQKLATLSAAGLIH